MRTSCCVYDDPATRMIEPLTFPLHWNLTAFIRSVLLESHVVVFALSIMHAAAHWPPMSNSPLSQSVTQPVCRKLKRREIVVTACGQEAS